MLQPQRLSTGGDSGDQGGECVLLPAFSHRPTEIPRGHGVTSASEGDLEVYRVVDPAVECPCQVSTHRTPTWSWSHLGVHRRGPTEINKAVEERDRCVHPLAQTGVHTSESRVGMGVATLASSDLEFKTADKKASGRLCNNRIVEAGVSSTAMGTLVSVRKWQGPGVSSSCAVLSGADTA